MAKKTAKKVAKKVAKKTASKTTKKTTNTTTKKAEKNAPAKAEVKSNKASEENAPKKKASKKAEVKASEEAKKDQGELDFSKKEQTKVLKEVKSAVAEEVELLSEDYSLKDIFEAIQSIDFFVSDTDDCIVKGCENPATTLGYCRYHYIENWKNIKRKQSILEEGKLQQFVEELVAKYPSSFVENILSDLEDEKSFIQVLNELNIEADESFDDVDDLDAEDDQDMAFETKGTVRTITDDE